MQTRIKFLIVVCLAGSAFVCFGQEAVVTEQNAPPLPYVAEIIGDNVYVRSGPGTPYYTCGKLNNGDRVKVVGIQYNVWSRIVPPTGSFSWIAKQHIKIDPQNPGIGIVTGNSVCVWAGSERLKPMHSTRMQAQRNEGEKVKLLGEGTEDYYKIEPPSGAYLWVSTKYTKPLSGGAVVVVEPRAEVETKVEHKPEPEVKPKEPAVVPTTVGAQDKYLTQYRVLEKQIDTEKAKPIAQQNYGGIRKALAEIAKDKGAGRVARYADFTLKQIKRYELAKEVDKAVRLQNADLQKIQERIDKDLARKLSEFQDLGKFAAVGKLQTSNVYNPQVEPQYWRIVDKSNKTVCYAVGRGPAAKADLSKLVGRKVGLVGTIEAHPQAGGALVRFTKITQIK